MSPSVDRAEHVRAALVALSAAEALHEDRAYVHLHGVGEINVLLTRAKIHLDLVRVLA